MFKTKSELASASTLIVKHIKAVWKSQHLNKGRTFLRQNFHDKTVVKSKAKYT